MTITTAEAAEPTVGRRPVAVTAPRDGAWSDQQLIAGFEAATLDAAAFGHPEHVRLTWLYLGRLPLLEALPRVADGLRRFARINGAEERYHQTITWAFVFLTHERMRDAPPGETWDAFGARNPDLLRSSILKRYYRPETLGSLPARRAFVMPDRLAEAESATACAALS